MRNRIPWREVACVVGGLTLALFVTHGRTNAYQNNILGIKTSTLHNGVAIASGATLDSAAFTQLGNTNAQSLQWRARSILGASHDVLNKVAINNKCSLDDVNYPIPGASGNVTNNGGADGAWHVDALTLPLSTSYKSSVTNNSTFSVTIDVIIGSQ